LKKTQRKIPENLITKFNPVSFYYKEKKDLKWRKLYEKNAISTVCIYRVNFQLQF